jgi:hypothetical protein
MAWVAIVTSGKCNLQQVTSNSRVAGAPAQAPISKVLCFGILIEWMDEDEGFQRHDGR